jgi:transposase-like protein
VFRDTWEGGEPQAVAAFFHEFEQTLGYMTVAFPRAHVSLIRTTNLLERFHKEIRRKQRDIGMLQSEAGGRRTVVYGRQARNRQAAGFASRQELRIREKGHTLPCRRSSTGSRTGTS